jgi:hypothetical protein
MGIEDIQISEKLETNAPSIKYSGNEGPKSPQEMEQMIMAQLEEEYAKYVFEMQEQGIEPMSMQQFIEQAMAEAQMSGGQPLPQDPTKPVNPFQPKPTGPVLPNRQMAAYGGIMGLDGRKQYGIGSFYQKYIKDPLEVAFTGKSYEDLERESQARVDREDELYGEGYESPFDTFFKGKRDDPNNPDSKRTGGANEYIIPVIGGALAGLFTKGTDPDNPGKPDDNTALALDDLKKSANILDQKEGMAAGLNFLPAVSARKYSPQEMIEVYQNAANGGRIGYNMGGSPFSELEIFKLKNLGYDVAGKGVEPFGGVEVLKDILRVNQQRPYAMGGRIGRAEGGIMDLGGMEKDYRAEGGFVPIGKAEKADDVPARLSVNEFVFTADAVRNAGGGDIDQGAKVMENMMKHLEAGGQVSEESQGMQGARDMFATSQRLGDVV